VQYKGRHEQVYSNNNNNSIITNNERRELMLLVAANAAAAIVRYIIYASGVGRNFEWGGGIYIHIF